LREDLAARFVTCIEIPALRERPGDVPILARYFLQAANRRAGRHATLSESALGALRVHRWPGNLVELEQMIEGLVRSSDEPRSRPLHAANEDANDGSEYRVPITRLAAQILLATGTRGDVALFLPRAEDVALFFEEEGAFVPIEEHGRVRVYARAAIACVSTRHTGTASEEDLLVTTRNVTVRMRHGSTFHGELRYDAAVPQARVVDFLNTPARSFTLYSEDMVHRIAKTHVESVEESK
jgi:transcriptional regulator with GAF, ATPase, and Fis domain